MNDIMNTQKDPVEVTLFGLRIQSEFDLPEVRGSKVVPEGGEKIVIRNGKVPSTISDEPWLADVLQVGDGNVLFRFAGVGAFLVEGGSRVTVEPEECAASNDVRTYLLGSVLGTLLHQRGLVPLHVSAVVSPSGIIAFTGHPGAGKSTTAFSLHRATGWPILCDDVAVVRMQGGEALLFSGTIRLKLWKDVLERHHIKQAGLTRDLVRTDKFHISAPGLFSEDGLPLRKLVQLDWCSDKELRRIHGAETFLTVLATIYRPYFIDLVGDRAAVHNVCAAVAKRIDVYRFKRPKHAPEASIKELIDLLLE
jgi:hypothetical protein